MQFSSTRLKHSFYWRSVKCEKSSAYLCPAPLEGHSIRKYEIFYKGCCSSIALDQLRGPSDSLHRRESIKKTDLSLSIFLSDLWCLFSSPFLILAFLILHGFLLFISGRGEGRGGAGFQDVTHLVSSAREWSVGLHPSPLPLCPSVCGDVLHVSRLERLLRALRVSKSAAEFGSITRLPRRRALERGVISSG